MLASPNMARITLGRQHMLAIIEPLVIHFHNDFFPSIGEGASEPTISQPEMYCSAQCFTIFQ
jgi:hypothetical protein